MKFSEDDIAYLGGNKKWVDIPCQHCREPIPMIYPSETYAHKIRHQQCPQEGGNKCQENTRE